ncbi:hypothetical protein V6Z11_A11G162600 [Gossypium hirsutum]
MLKSQGNDKKDERVRVCVARVRWLCWRMEARAWLLEGTEAGAAVQLWRKGAKKT